MSSRTREKIKIVPDLLREAMQYRHISIRGIGKLPYTDFHWSSKSVERALKNGEMSRDLLHGIAQYLNIDPEYIQGKYHKGLEKLDPDVATVLRRSLTPGRFPYTKMVQIRALQGEQDDGSWLYDKTIDQLLFLHDIDPLQHQSLSSGAQLALAADLERAVVPVLLKYFPENAIGKDADPDIWRLLNEIEGAQEDLAMSATEGHIKE